MYNVWLTQVGYPKQSKRQQKVCSSNSDVTAKIAHRMDLFLKFICWFLLTCVSSHQHRISQNLKLNKTIFVCLVILHDRFPWTPTGALPVDPARGLTLARGFHACKFRTLGALSVHMWHPLLLHPSSISVWEITSSERHLAIRHMPTLTNLGKIVCVG